MSQSGFIAALLLAAFILFLAAQDRLVKYAAVLWGDTSKPINKPAPSGGSGGSSGGGSDPLKSLGDAATVAAFLA